MQKQIALPYDMENVFTVKESKWEKLLRRKKVVFYGEGYLCGTYLGLFERLGFPAPIDIWDRKAEEIKSIEGIPVLVPTEALLSLKRDICVVVTIGDTTISKEVKEWLQTKGIVDIAVNEELLKWIVYQLWGLISAAGEDR